MIRALRSRHRWIMVALTLVVPALFVAGLVARRPMPVTDLPHFGETPIVSTSAVGTQVGNLTQGESVTVLWFDSGSSELPRIGVELASGGSLPEVLVYWVASVNDGMDSLPPRSRLIGALRGSELALFELPHAVTRASPGHLVFFVLSQTAILGSVDLDPPDAIFPNETKPGSAS